MPSTKNCMKAYVSEEEYAMITEEARMCGLSVSQFVKAVCLGFEVRSREDQHARVELRRVHADLGRLGGLLKMWLTNANTRSTSADYWANWKPARPSCGVWWHGYDQPPHPVQARER